MAHTMLGIGNVAFICIPYRCSSCLRKMDSTWNIIQDNYNQYPQKGENKQCVYWPILGLYTNWKIIHCIDSKNNTKQPIMT